jgi:hypothetical protein
LPYFLCPRWPTTARDNDISNVVSGFSLDGFGAFTAFGPGHDRGGAFYSPNRSWEFGLSSARSDNHTTAWARSRYEEAVDAVAAASEAKGQKIERARRSDGYVQESTVYARYTPLRFLTVHTGLGYRVSEIEGRAYGKDPFPFDGERTYGSWVNVRSEAGVAQLGLASDYDVSLKGTHRVRLECGAWRRLFFGVDSVLDQG